MTPPPPSPRLWLDYTYARPDLTGYVGVLRYLNIHDWYTKGLTVAEAADLHAKGVSIALICESSADAATEGATRAIEHVTDANAEADRLGVPPDVVIFYAVDFDVTSMDQIREYVTTLLTRPGRPVGIYGEADVTQWARSVGVRWTWQTYAWSKTTIDFEANIYQYNNTGEYDISLERHPFPAWNPS